MYILQIFKVTRTCTFTLGKLLDLLSCFPQLLSSHPSYSAALLSREWVTEVLHFSQISSHMYISLLFWVTLPALFSCNFCSIFELYILSAPKLLHFQRICTLNNKQPSKNRRIFISSHTNYNLKMWFIQTVSAVSYDCRCEQILTDWLGTGFVLILVSSGTMCLDKH